MVEEREPTLPLGSFLFPRIFRAFGLSLQPAKLTLAFLALAAICGTGWVMDWSRTVVVADRFVLMDAQGKPTVLGQPTELDVYARSAASVPGFLAARRAEHQRAGVFGTLWHFGAGQFRRGLYSIFLLDSHGVLDSVANCVKALIWAFQYHPLYSIIFFMAVLAVLSLAGGALCRIAALEFARAQRASLAEALRFGIRRFASLFTAPLAPVVVILVFGLVLITLPGLAGNIPVVGELLVGLSLPLAVLAAGVVVVFLVGTVAGLNLMFPAVAYEDADCFDAMGRSFSYVYTGLWRLGFYTLVAVVYGAVCYVVVRFFAFLLLWVVYRFLQIGFFGHNEKLLQIWSGPLFDNFYGAVSATPHTWSVELGAWLVRFWITVVVGLVASFAISFYFSAHTIIYALMRNRVDKTPLDEVYTGPEESALETAAVARAAGTSVSEQPPQIQADAGPVPETE
jgi:hypothetical protein